MVTQVSAFPSKKGVRLLRLACETWARDSRLASCWTCSDWRHATHRALRRRIRRWRSNAPAGSRWRGSCADIEEARLANAVGWTRPGPSGGAVAVRRSGPLLQGATPPSKVGPQQQQQQRSEPGVSEGKVAIADPGSLDHRRRLSFWRGTFNAWHQSWPGCIENRPREMASERQCFCGFNSCHIRKCRALLLGYRCSDTGGLGAAHRPEATSSPKDRSVLPPCPVASRVLA